VVPRDPPHAIARQDSLDRAIVRAWSSDKTRCTALSLSSDRA
jgi:hypothetical protein